MPVIHFGVGTGAILAELRQAGGDVIGADWRTPLDDAWQRIGFDRAIQGNLDPTVLLGPIDRALAATDDVLARAGGRPGHIFNLGHGILPVDASRPRAGDCAICASADKTMMGRLAESRVPGARWVARCSVGRPR